MSKDLFANMDEPSFTRRKFPQLEEEKREAELIEQAKENNNLITLPITQLVMDPDNESSTFLLKLSIMGSKVPSWLIQ